MSKFNLTKGRVEEPEFFILYGVEGIGKTTFAASAPRSVIVDIEGGSHQIDEDLDYQRISEDQLKTTRDVVEAINDMANDEWFETIVIDSASRLEKIIWNEVASENGKKSIEDIGYAKGYIFALEKWEAVLNACKSAKKKGKNVIIIAHNFQKTFQDPTKAEGYIRYELELHHKAASLLKKNVDAIYFANYKTLIKDGRGYDTDERCLYTERRAGHDAKNRFGLPYEVQMNWKTYQEAKKNAVITPDVLLRQIHENMKQISDEDIKNKIMTALEGEKSVSTLKSYLARVNTIIGEQE